MCNLRCIASACVGLYLKLGSRRILGILLASNFFCAGLAHGIVIGVDLIDVDTLRGSPNNWNSSSRNDAGNLITGLIAEDGTAAAGVGFTLSGLIKDFDGDPAGSEIPQHPNDLTKLCCDGLYNDPGLSTPVATWSGLSPLATYNYWFITSASAAQTITVAGSGTPDSFVSPNIGSSDPLQAINDAFGTDSRTFASYARQVEASAGGTITIEIGTAGYPAASGFAVELVPIPAAAWLLGSGLLGLVGISRRKGLA